MPIESLAFLECSVPHDVVGDNGAVFQPNDSHMITDLDEMSICTQTFDANARNLLDYSAAETSKNNVNQSKKQREYSSYARTHL